MDLYAKAIGEAIGKELGGLGTGVMYVIQALKNQPGFDTVKFQEEIQYYIDNLPPEGGSTKRFLQEIIK